MLVNLHIYSRRSICFIDAHLMIPCNFRILKMSISYENCFELGGKCYWANLLNAFFFIFSPPFELYSIWVACIRYVRLGLFTQAISFVSRCFKFSIHFSFKKLLNFNIFLTTIAILQACAAVKYTTGGDETIELVLNANILIGQAGWWFQSRIAAIYSTGG